VDELLNSIRKLAEETVIQKDAYFYAIDNVGFGNFDDAAEHAVRLFYLGIRQMFKEHLQ
jgi:hypothetical protein